MFLQDLNYPGIYIYTKQSAATSGTVCDGLYVNYYATFEAFFKVYNEKVIASSFTSIDHIYDNLPQCAPKWWEQHYEQHYHAAYDENGKYLSVSFLVGKYRKWLEERRKYWRAIDHNRRHGSKRRVYGWYRHIRTTHELSMYFDDPTALELGFNVKGRASRNCLPTVWDDVRRHNDKSWKTQSKRRRQWKSTTSS
jgi:hypothetical protein